MDDKFRKGMRRDFVDSVERCFYCIVFVSYLTSESWPE